MNQPYIALIGTYNEFTTEQIVLKEVKVDATDKYNAHKVALFKCNVNEGHIVLKIIDYNTKQVLFNFAGGFSN